MGNDNKSRYSSPVFITFRKLKILVLVSQNLSFSLFFEYFMPASYDLNKKAPPNTFNHLHTRFLSALLFLFYKKKLCQPSFVLVILFPGDNAFSKQRISFLKFHAGQFTFCFFAYLFFFNDNFYISAIMKLQSIISLASDLSSHQIL